MTREEDAELEAARARVAELEAAIAAESEAYDLAVKYLEGQITLLENQLRELRYRRGRPRAQPRRRRSPRPRK